MIRRLILFVLTASACAGPAAAQATFTGPLSAGAFEATLGQGPIANALRPQQQPPQQRSGGTRFVRDPAQLRRAQQQVLAAIRQRSPQVANELTPLFSQDLLAVIGPELKRLGLRDDDMADMTAVYWITAWEGANGIVGSETDPKVAKAARDQLAGVLAADPAVATMTDRDKQFVADTMFLQGVFNELRMEAAATTGPKLKQQTSDAIYAEAKQALKTDLRQMTLGVAGFTPTAPGAGQ